MTPDEFRDLIPDYVLGLLSPSQSAALEAACRVDAELAAEVARFESLMGDLGTVVPQFEPPPDLEARILAEAAQHQPRVKPFSIRPYMLVTAAAILLTVIGLGFLVNNGSDDPVQEILDANNSQFRDISGTDLQPDLHGRFTWNDEIQRGVLELKNVAVLDETQSYQIWFVESETSRMSATVFHTAPNKPLLLDLPDQFGATYQFVGMTIEPASGSAEPTSPPIFLIALQDE